MFLTVAVLRHFANWAISLYGISDSTKYKIGKITSPKCAEYLFEGMRAQWDEGG
jgi:hypothetical protein